MSSTAKPAYWLMPAAVVLGVLVLLVAPIGLGPGELNGAVEDSAHPVIFALVAYWCVRWLRRTAHGTLRRHAYFWAFVFAVGLGGGGEIAQYFTATRDPAWNDFGNDIVGAIAGLCLYALYGSRKRRSSTTRAVLFVVVVVTVLIWLAPLLDLSRYYLARREQLPNLVVWDHAAGHHFVRGMGADIAVVAAPDAHDAACRFALRVEPDVREHFAGVAFEEPWPDWQGYSQLTMDVMNSSAQPLTLTMRINDQQHNNEYNDRYNASLTIPPQHRSTWQVPLAQIRAAPANRKMDMRHIAKLVIFENTKVSRQSFYLCSMRLDR